MKNILRQIIFAAILIVFCAFVSYSIYISNHREYTRSEATGKIFYQNDYFSTSFEKIAGGIGMILKFLVFIGLCYLIFILGRHVCDIYSEYFSKYSVNNILIYIFLFLFIAIGSYSFITLPFGQTFVLEPFFGKKIYYGGYENIINAIEFQVDKVKKDKDLSDEKKKVRIEQLREALKYVMKQKEAEESFCRLEQKLRYIPPQ